MNWRSIIVAIKITWEFLPKSVRDKIQEIIGDEWKKVKVRIFLHILHQALIKAWHEALNGPSIDESCPPAGETAERLRGVHKTREKTAEAIIEQHRDHMEGLFKSLPDDWRERIFEEDPPAQWAKEADIQQIFIFHLLYVAALAQIGGHSLYLPRTRDLCFACLTGKEEAIYLLENYQEGTELWPLVVSTLWKHRFSKSKDARIEFRYRNSTVRGIDRGLMDKNTTQDIIAAARRIFAV